MSKLFSPACERNRDPILGVLREVLPKTGHILEVGSGSGQHAAYFGQHLPTITWQPSDRDDTAHDSIRAWREEHEASNVAEPVIFDLFAGCPVSRADAVVCINTIHIAPWAATARLFEHSATLLEAGAPLFLYGPFRYRDRELEPSNANFDVWLRQRNPQSGIRTFEDIDEIAQTVGFAFGGDRSLPSNNHALWWLRV